MFYACNLCNLCVCVLQVRQPVLAEGRAITQQLGKGGVASVSYTICEGGVDCVSYSLYEGSIGSLLSVLARLSFTSHV